MKKRISKLCLLFLFCNIYGINYKTVESTKLYESDGTFNYYARDIDENETVKISKAQIYYGVSDWKYSVEILYHDFHYFTNAENLIPENTQDILSDNISLIYSENAKWFPAYCFDMLKEQNRDVVKSKQQNGFRGYQDRKTEFDYEWYYTLSFLTPSYFFNSVVTISLLFDNCSFLVKNISKEKSDYLIEAEVYDWFMPDAIHSYSEGNHVLLKVSADGDYLNLFCDDKLLGQFVKTNNETRTEIESLIRNNTCDLSKVNWPRHADGSCDYEDERKSAVRKPALAAGKTMTVCENLKLRSGEATSTQVLAVLSAGTHVKVLVLGKAETIDGIASNWVKVEVLPGAKDKDGNPIRAGTTGWCYGGYLE